MDADETLSISELESIFRLAVWGEQGNWDLEEHVALAKLAEILDAVKPRPKGAQTRGELILEMWGVMPDGSLP